MALKVFHWVNAVYVSHLSWNFSEHFYFVKSKVEQGLKKIKDEKKHEHVMKDVMKEKYLL